MHQHFTHYLNADEIVSRSISLKEIALSTTNIYILIEAHIRKKCKETVQE